MFRYLGFNWTLDSQAKTAFALQLDASIRTADGWQCALSAPGLRVYTFGSRRGVNGSYALPFGEGVVLGRLFRKRDIAARSRDIVISSSEGYRILETDGRALVDEYWGRYVAVLKSANEGARLLRDPSGALPCFQQHIKGVTIFFSWFEDLISLRAYTATPRVDWDAIAALFAIGHLGGRYTGIEGVAQILPGELTALQDNGQPPKTLWSAVDIARRPIEDDPEPAAGKLRRMVIGCSQAWSSCHESILLRLSGGVDSAILLGSLCVDSPATRITCLNYYSAGSDSDERPYARLAAAKSGVKLVERARDAEFRLDDLLQASRTPTPESYTGRLGTSHIDAEVAAAHHANAMFTGAGGDQLFFQLRSTWPAADYLGRHGIGLGFVRASLEAARLGRVSLWESMRRAFVDRRYQANLLDGVGRFSTLANRETIDGLQNLEKHIHPALFGATDLPIGKFHQVEQLINPPGYYDPYLKAAAPTLVNPLLSQPLIELCLQFPTWLLTHGGRGRALARKAFAPELPREISLRQSKGGMEEHVTAILQRNLALARELLLDGYLVRQGLLDRRKVEAALGDQLSARGAYVVEIHDCIAIEAWIRRIMEYQRPMAA